MCAYLLIALLKFQSKVDLSMQKIFRLLQLNLFEKRHLNDLLDQDKHGKPNVNDHQPMSPLKVNGTPVFQYIFYFMLYFYKCVDSEHGQADYDGGSC